jgi:Zn-dependent alcohol dehydrogenase
MLFYFYNFHCLTGWKSKEGVPKLVDLYMKNELMVDEFISKMIDLDGVNDAFDLLRGGKG